MASSLNISAIDHPIRGVTVYKSHRAEVVRVFSLDLQSGNTKIDITELPSCIDTHSVRVSGLGEARLFDVVCTTRKNTSLFKPAPPSETVRQLRAQKAALLGQKRVRDFESDFLVTYAKTLSGEHVTPAQMGEFLQSFVSSGQKNLESVAEIEEKIFALDHQIEEQFEKEALKRGDATGVVTVVVGTDAPLNVDLKLTYIVSNASWSSTYELHASTENGKPSSTVTLHYRAHISQSTGEDWTDTALTLSTVAASTMVRNIPYLSPIKIRPQNRAAQGLFNNANKFTNTNANVNPFVQQNNNSNTRIGPFGEPTQKPQFGFGPFGSSNTTPAAPQASTGGLFGGSSGGFGAPAQTTSIFGSAPAQGQSLFGSSAPQGSGLFGQPTFSGGLFGNPQAQAQTHPIFAQPAQAFGGSAAVPSGFGGGSAQTQAFGSQSTTATTGAAFGAVTVAPTERPVPDMPVPEEVDEFEEIAIPGAQAGPTTIVTETPLAVSYAVEGATTIPSDGTAHQVAVAVLPFEAKITHICTPRLDARVYLQCNVKNTSEYRLLPGAVSVVLNDSFVSKTSINEINTGDTFACTLGDDAATKVTYSRSSKTKTLASGSFAESLNSTTYTTNITIHNKHPFALTDLVVRDVVPTSDDTRAKVLLHKPAGLADAKDGQVVKLEGQPPGLTVCWGKTADGRPGEKEGRIEWGWSVEAGKKAELQAEWELRAPADVNWVEFVPLFGSQ
ncbi:hypothetical protein C8F01DRAFT_1251594 [Mycena amicta]|nr:hypothetical protein C8F01DRAFT_1251594 [Mycena amicta]